jgi:hypothetical protein
MTPAILLFVCAFAAVEQWQAKAPAPPPRLHRWQTLVGLAFSSAACAEIIDRIAVTVDSSVITESRIREEIRVTAFLNGEQPNTSLENRRRAAERLVDQILIQREMDLMHYTPPESGQVNDTIKQLKVRYGGDAGYQAALKRYYLTESQVRDALLRQTALLDFIDLRFKPEVQVGEADLLQYYENVCLPEAKQRGGRPPTREQCDDALIAQRVDQRVEAWLKEARNRSNIHYMEDAFQ